MKKWFVNLSTSQKTVFISLIVVMIAFFGLMFGYFVGLMGLPNGLLAGGFLGIMFYIFLGLTEKRDSENKKPVWTIVLTIVRFIFIGALVALSALLEYQVGLKIMNVFTVLGGYFISLITNLVIVLMEKKNV